MKRIILIVGILYLLTLTVNATTWFPVEHTCTICNQKNEYQEIGSYGSYIYSWESKYQYIYWPYTDGPTVYCCPKCHFSTFMWDFDSIPENKIDTITNFLKTISIDKKFNDVSYLEIPITIRLEIAEAIYKILERDNEFWCHFYRVIGYHYDQEEKFQQSQEYRLKALNIARLMILDKMYDGQKKEIFFIIAAMHNFTGQNDSALFYLDKASKLKFKNKKWEKEDVKGVDQYLTALIMQYKEFIRKGDEE